MESQFTTIKLSQMTWRFSASVIDAFQGIGIPIPGGLNSFIMKVLSMKVVREGPTEVNMMGLGLKIVKRKYNILVHLIEEGGDE